MGPTTAALLRFFHADTAFQHAQERLAAATSNVRGQGSRVDELRKEYDAAHHKALELEAKARELDLELKAREERIELLRTRQTNATDQKQYGALIIDINTQKLDKSKIEEQALGLMDQVETMKKLAADLKARLENEGSKHTAMSGEIDARVKELSADVEQTRAPRDEIAKSLPAVSLATYRRAAERYHGEAMAAIEKPDPRDVEYLCTGCNTYLVANIYNRLMSSKDEIVLCPSCTRILYVPTDMTPEFALSKKLARGDGPAKPKKAAKAPKLNEDGTPIVPKPRKPRVKKNAPSETGASIIAAGRGASPESLAAALAAGALAATGKGKKAKETSAAAPLPSRGDGNANVSDLHDAPNAPTATASESESGSNVTEPSAAVQSAPPMESTTLDESSPDNAANDATNAADVDADEKADTDAVNASQGE